MAIKTYRYTTEEGLEIKVELTFNGTEDGYQCQDWEVSVKPSEGYVVNDYDGRDSFEEPGFTVRTSKKETAQ